MTGYLTSVTPALEHISGYHALTSATAVTVLGLLGNYGDGLSLGAAPGITSTAVTFPKTPVRAAATGLRGGTARMMHVFLVHSRSTFG